MYTFSVKSEAELATCDSRLQQIARIAITVTDFSVVEGTRNKEDQENDFATGKSKLQYPESKHNSSPSKAFDFVPCIDGVPNWDDKTQFAYVAGIMRGIGLALGIPIRCGADFNENGVVIDQEFKDFPHIEIKE